MAKVLIIGLKGSLGGIRILYKSIKQPNDSSNIQKRNYLNYFGDFVGQMVFISPPRRMPNGSDKIQLGPDRVLKGFVLDWYQTL